MAWKTRTTSNHSYIRGSVALLLIVCVILLCSAMWKPSGHSDVTLRSSKVKMLENKTFGTPRSTKGNQDSNDYVQEMKKMNQEKVAADNYRLVELIRKYYLVPPSTQPCNLESQDLDDRSMGQAPIVDSRLHYKECGFFFESGAFDGETLSNTLFFERKRNWQGILIEPNSLQYKKLLNKHRKAFSINACLSTEEYPSEKLIFDDHLTSKIIQGEQTEFPVARKASYLVQCFPLYSILLALNRTNIDFLSLDVEGMEQGVLDTIPWHKVNIQMMTIEYDKWSGGSRSLCKYMERRDYDCLVTLSGRFVADVILTKKKRLRRFFGDK